VKNAFTSSHFYNFVLYFSLLCARQRKAFVNRRYFKLLSFIKPLTTKNILYKSGLVNIISDIWCDVDPCEVFMRPLHSRLLIVHTNHFSDNDVPLGSATASTRSWWVDQSCNSKLLRGLCSCAVHQLRRQGEFCCYLEFGAPTAV